MFLSERREFDAEEIDVELDYSTDSMTNLSTANEGVVAKGVQINFHAELDTGSIIQVQSVLIRDGGDISTPNETWTVKPGDFKFKTPGQPYTQWQ